jgi:amino acid permease
MLNGQRSTVNGAAKKPINISYWFVFALATYSITQFFGGYRYFQSQGFLVGSLINAAWILVFVISIVYLAYKIYSEEKQRNNLRVSFAPFDVIYQWTNQRGVTNER